MQSTAFAPRTLLSLHFQGQSFKPPNAATVHNKYTIVSSPECCRPASSEICIPSWAAPLANPVGISGKWVMRKSRSLAQVEFFIGNECPVLGSAKAMLPRYCEWQSTWRMKVTFHAVRRHSRFPLRFQSVSGLSVPGFDSSACGIGHAERLSYDEFTIGTRLM